MNIPYEEYAVCFRALSDPNRLRIVEMLSCGELCACKVLEKFQISQPTLSHHMKTLCGCGLVRARREGRWTHYSLDGDRALRLRDVLAAVPAGTGDCICRDDCCGPENCCEQEDENG